MSKRLEGKAAVVVGGGQTPGDTIGNGRATALLFAREGARVLVVDRVLARAQDTVDEIRKEGGTAEAFEADVTQASACRAMVESATKAFGSLDVLHNNVGIGDGDGSITRVGSEAWDHIQEVNVKTVLLACQAAIPVMREQGGGVILNISSIAAVAAASNLLAYKTSKAAVNALTHGLAMGNARFGIRVNAILPGLMNTPMAIEGISEARGVSKQRLIEERDAQVPLGRQMGSGWDTAHAALFLASDEARFITGVLLPVDGGQSARIG